MANQTDMNKRNVWIRKKWNRLSGKETATEWKNMKSRAKKHANFTKIRHIQFGFKKNPKSNDKNNNNKRKWE